MKTTLFLNGRKVSMKTAIEKLGKERVEKYIHEAWEFYQIDPMVEQSWYTGAGMLTIEFGY